MADNAPKDRVVMVTRNPDGSPKQGTADFEIIGDKDFAVRAAAEQLGQLAVSNEDYERARAAAAEAAGVAGPSLSPEEEERIGRHRQLMTDAAQQAASEVEGKHSGDQPAPAPVERSVPVEAAVTRSGRARKSAG